MKKHISGIITALIFLCGVGLLSFPLLRYLINQSQQAAIVNDYTKVLDTRTQEEMEQERERARRYNESLNGHVELTDPFSAEPQTSKQDNYSSVLNLAENGIMGTVRIPRIQVSLPIYHGTDFETLEKGAGHLQQTSLPIGGTSSHTVISAHTGSPTASFFDDLVNLEKGDMFFLDVLDETLAYQVDQISVVLPGDIQDLEIVPDRDYATLITCTPYGVNTHRLLVRGIRTDYRENDGRQGSTGGIGLENRYTVLVIICFTIIILAILIILIISVRKRKRKSDNKGGNRE